MWHVSDGAEGEFIISSIVLFLYLGSKFRRLTVALSIEKITKEAIRMVLKFIYDLKFPNTLHFCVGRVFHSVVGQIKEEWELISRKFLEFDIKMQFINHLQDHRYLRLSSQR